MVLKSDGFVSNLSAPSADSTLKAYCARHGLPYADQGLPVPLDRFLAYAESFRRRFVPTLEETYVTALERGADGFLLTLDSGERVQAKAVVLAVGITWFAYTPALLSALPKSAVSHSFAHRDAETFKGREVAIVGSGASAVDLALLLHEAGASVRIVARTPALEFNSVPEIEGRSLLQRLQEPPSGIGRGWSSYFCARAPLLFYRLPEHLKARAIRSHMQPAAGWFMRDKVEGHIAMTLGRALAGAESHQDRVYLTLRDAAGREETLSCDHVIAATGYRPQMRRLPFLSPALCARIAPDGNTPFLSDNFETNEKGLYVVGPAAIESFGPLMRFMVSAEFTAPRVSAHLRRRFGAGSVRRAA
jgi:thioredoxin reductase